MNVSEQDYHKLARVLDGEDLPLSLDQRKLLEQIRSDERELRGALDVRVPAKALRRAQKRIETQLQAPRYLIGWIAGAASAAAAGVLAISLLWQSPAKTPQTPTAIRLPEPTAEQFLQALAGEPEDEMIRDTADEIDQLGFQLSLASQDPLAEQIETIDADLIEAERETRELLDHLVSEIPEM